MLTWRLDSYLWKRLESFPSTGSISVVEALLGSFYCPDVLGVPSTYFISKVWTLSALACLSVSATGLLYEMKLILPVGKSFIFAQLVGVVWKDLKVFGQLNKVNLKPINILRQFGLRKIFSTLNKRGEQHLFSVEETCLTFSSVKSASPCGTLPHGFKEEMWDGKQRLKFSLFSQICACKSGCVWSRIVVFLLRYVFAAVVIIFSFNWICLGLNGLILMD